MTLPASRRPHTSRGARPCRSPPSPTPPRSSPTSRAAAWPTSTRAPAAARRSCSSTATPPPPTCGATSCPTALASAGSSPAISSAWATATSSPPPAPTATPTPSSATICSRCGTTSPSATGSSSSSTTGARHWASSGRAAIPSASPASPTWRLSSRPSRGPIGRRTRAACSRVSAPPPARTWCWPRTPSSSACCPARSCASSRTRRGPNTAVPSPHQARTAAPP